MDAQEMTVWSRVLSPGHTHWSPELLGEAEALAEEYSALGLTELYRSARQCVRLLRGIAALEGSRPPEPGRRPRQSRERRRLLTQCFHRSRRLMAEYAARTAQPETGLLYQHLEQLQREHCITLAGILGSGQ